VNDELKRMRKEVVTAYFKVKERRVRLDDLREVAKNSAWSVFRPRSPPECKRHHLNQLPRLALLD
jgi:hypothetical protein